MKTKTTKVNGLLAANQLHAMIKKHVAGDDDARLKDTIARMAVALGSADIDVDAAVAKAATELAGEITPSSSIQQPSWRATVKAARRSKKKK